MASLQINDLCRYQQNRAADPAHSLATAAGRIPITSATLSHAATTSPRRLATAACCLVAATFSRTLAAAFPTAVT